MRRSMRATTPRASAYSVLSRSKKKTATEGSAIGTQHRHHAAAAREILFLGVDRRHALVGWLQADLAVLLAEESLDRRFAVHHCDDRLAVLGRGPLFDDDVITVEDAVLDHRVAFHAQDVTVFTPYEIRRHRDRTGHLDGLDRLAGGDLTEQRQLDCRRLSLLRHQLESPAVVPLAADDALLFEVGQVLVHGGGRGQVEAGTDLLESRGIA